MKQTKVIPLMGIVSLKTKLNGDELIAEGVCVTKLRGCKDRFDTHKVQIDIPIKENAIDIVFGSRYGRKLPKGTAINSFRITINIKEAEEWDVQNKLLLNYDGIGKSRIFYNILDIKLQYEKIQEEQKEILSLTCNFMHWIQ